MVKRTDRQRRRPMTKQPGKAADDRDRGRGILTKVNVDGLRALRFLALVRDCTLQALAVEALNDVLAKYGHRRIVRNPLLDD
jgi:hypothetical protein